MNQEKLKGIKICMLQCKPMRLQIWRNWN